MAKWVRMTESEFLKLAEEFLNIEDESKFISDYVFLSDGKRIASRFFRAYRKAIEASENDVCKNIMKQYYAFIDKKRRINKGQFSSEIRTDMIEEFAYIDDIRKFDYKNSDIVLSNGEIAGVFFARGKWYIEARKTTVSDLIEEQYKKYLE